MLNEKLRLLNDELENVKQDKTCIEKELGENIKRLQRMVEASKGNDQEKQAILVQESFTDLVNKKLHLEREVLRESVLEG